MAMERAVEYRAIVIVRLSITSYPYYGRMIKTRIYKMALVGLAGLLLCVSSLMQNGLNMERHRLGLTRLPPLQNAPPLLAFTTVALGGLRGLIANYLWMRMNDLQNDDKYFEMVQLADWTTALEPHFVQVWTDQAWNMAYNVSVKFKNPEDRWHWVQRGIELLRDRGIPLNPDAPLLYRELSWFFQHKIGQNLDDANMTYKLRWAQEMQNVLGARPNIEALEHPTTAEEKERARKLRDVYKMDPAIICKVDAEYGPFDWRLPDAHAVYWAELYREKANQTNSLWPGASAYETNSYDTDTLRRSIFQSLRMACLRGGALAPSVTNVTAENFMLWPNLDLVSNISATYEKMIQEQPNLNFQNAHKNFLKEAIPLLYINGRLQQARIWFDYLKKNYTNSFIGKQANISLKDFVLATVAEDDTETDPNRVMGNLEGMYIMEFRCLLSDQDAEAVNYDNLAKDVWNHYRDKIGTISKQRLELRPWPEIKRRVLDSLLDPQTRSLSSYGRSYLRTKLGLRSPGASETTPAVAPAPPEVPAGAPGAP
jgi:hypothetical protein